jgi:hypothetical protein
VPATSAVPATGVALAIGAGESLEIDAVPVIGRSEAPVTGAAP